MNDDIQSIVEYHLESKEVPTPQNKPNYDPYTESFLTMLTPPFIPLPDEYFNYRTSAIYKRQHPPFQVSQSDYAIPKRYLDPLLQHKPKYLLFPNNIDDFYTLTLKSDLFDPIRYAKMNVRYAIFMDLQIFLTHKIHRTDNQITFKTTYIKQVEYPDENKTKSRRQKFKFGRYQKKEQTQTFKLEDIKRIIVFKQITKHDLCEIFPTISFNKKDYQYLYHGTGDHSLNYDKYNQYLLSPGFYAPYPLYRNPYLTDRYCLIYEVKKNINCLLDLTRPKIFENVAVAITDKGDQIFYKPDINLTDSLIKKGQYKTWKHQNNTCLTFQGQEKDCKVGGAPRVLCTYYGRLILRLFALKTIRIKYALLESVDYDTDIKLINQIKGINGFFSTDFDYAKAYGGEIYLNQPSKFLELTHYKKSSCFDDAEIRTDFK